MSEFIVFLASENASMIVKLSDITTIQFGYYDTPSEEEGLHYLQARHFDEDGEFTLFDTSYIPFDDKSRKHILQSGDILLAGKGYRLFAWQYNGQISPAVASTLFFVIKIADPQRVLPQYLTTFLNLPQTQTYLRQLGAGTSIPSIRKNELSELAVPLPDLATQEQVVQIQTLHKRQLTLLNQLIAEKQQLVENLIKKLIHASPETST